MPRILWLGDAGCTTGFGRVTHAIGERLVNDYGYDIHVLAVNFNGDSGAWPTPLRLYRPTLNNGSDVYGIGRYVEMLSEVMPDLVFILNDPYMVMTHLLRNPHDTELMMARARPIVAYVPVDGYDLPSNWAKLPAIVNRLPKVEGGTGPLFVPALMSKFGETLYPGAPVIPHGVDPFFRPVTPKEPIITSTGVKVTSKRDAKKVFGFTGDEILVLRVDRNSHRKDFGASWKALIPVMRRNPQVHAWFHCRFDGDQLELSQVLSREPALADRFHFPDRFRTQRGWADVDLLTLYNAADIFLSTSWGEGFGLTLGEAAAVGLPIVAQNVSAIPEVVGPGGILLEPERRITVGSGQDQWLPNVDSFSEAIERLVESRGARRELGEAGRRHVTASFSWDDSARRFHELITATISEAERQSSGGPSGSSTARS